MPTRRLLQGLTSPLGQKLLGHAGAAARDLYRLAGDRRVRLAVTGLSRSGKSVFITSLVNQLLSATPQRHRLARLRALQQGRFIAAVDAPQPDSTVPTFRYARYRDQLFAEVPEWPAGTTDISQLRLQIRTRPEGMVSGLFGDARDVYVDITDYPGEWLVDLPLLETDFASWSAEVWAQSQRPHLAALSAPWRGYIAGRDAAAADRDGAAALERAHALFRDYLLAAKAHGYNFLQPGRMVLPGSLDGAPAVTFSPCPRPDAPAADSLYARCEARFGMYQRDVIEPFYRRHFAAFDGQVVLTDLQYALEQGPEHFADTQKTLNTLLQSFRHGRSGLLGRLFSPKIDRVLFAVTKVDQVNRAQYDNLRRLLEDMLRDSLRGADFHGVGTLTLALAAVRATDTVVDEDGREFVRGRLLEQPPDAPPEELYYAPGAVPDALPADASWREQPFRFYAFHPPRLDAADLRHGLPHVNMDAALEFLLGDRL